MKRIIMLCSMFVLLLALSVPAFAVEELSVSPLFAQDLTVTDVSTGEVVPYSNGNRKTLQFNRVYKIVSTSSYYTNVIYNLTQTDDGYDLPLGTSADNPAVWTVEDFSKIFMFSATSRTTSTKSYYFIIESLCDGSTCPATDGNMDNICDDCGAPFAVLRDYTLPDPYAVWTDQSTYPYAMVTLGNNLYLLPSLPFYYDIGSYIRHEGGTYERYKIEDGQWVYDYTSSNPVNLGTLEDVQHSSFDLNYEGAILIYRDSDFFPKSLQEVIQEGVTEMAHKTVGTMTILVACGVGLMACLVVLSLFGRRSLIFLR